MTVNYGALAGIAALTSGLNFAGGITASNVSSKKARKLAAYQAQLNYNYNKQWAENSPSFTRSGLESAGYNPMLAVQNGTVAGNASSFASPNSANDVDLGLGSGIANALDLKRVDNETKTAESTVNLQNEQAETENDKRINFRFDSMMKDAKKHMTDKLTSWIDREKNAQIYKDMQQAEQARAIASVQSYNAETARISANASAKYNDTIKEIADKHSPTGKSQSFRNYTGGVSDILNGIGHVIHGYNESIDSNSSNDSETVYYDKNGNVRGSVSHKGKSNSHSSKKHKRR